MSEMRRWVWLAAALGLIFTVYAGQAEAAAFKDKKLLVDTEINTGAEVNDAKVTLLPVSAGDTVRVEFFVEGAAGLTTIGYDLQFDDEGGAFSDKFTIEDVLAGIVGKLGSPSANTITAGGLAAVTVGTNDYIATVTLTAKVDIADGTTIKMAATTTVGDAATFEQDVLDVSAAMITFAAPPTPKMEADDAKPVIPMGGEATSTITLSNLTVGDVVELTVAVDGAAMVEINGAAVPADGKVSITAAAATEVVTVKASGSGFATVDITGTVAGSDLAPLQIVFTEQVPVELASFGGELVEGRVVISWTTASQTNNAGWRVLRSSDGETYEVVSEIIPGAGTSDVLLSYSFVDEDLPSSEMAFYRLDQVDLDGSIHTSSSIEVILGARFLPPTEFAANVYPNPFNPSTTISYDLPNSAMVSIVIYDALGQEVRRLISETKEAGRYKVQWDAKDYQGYSVGSGVYIAKIEAGAFSASQKMLLLK